MGIEVSTAKSSGPIVLDGVGGKPSGVWTEEREQTIHTFSSEANTGFQRSFIVPEGVTSVDVVALAAREAMLRAIGLRAVRVLVSW
ncbi:MAG: hypothetical protein GX542_13855 [Rhodococcus sp.]|nr:hypothetical protein [Rhodococcus sp. (in: high G+C Gram-positive bacteria)]